MSEDLTIKSLQNTTVTLDSTTSTAKTPEEIELEKRNKAQEEAKKASDSTVIFEAKDTPAVDDVQISQKTSSSNSNVESKNQTQAATVTTNPINQQTKTQATGQSTPTSSPNQPKANIGEVANVDTKTSSFSGKSRVFDRAARTICTREEFERAQANFAENMRKIGQNYDKLTPEQKLVLNALQIQFQRGEIDLPTLRLYVDEFNSEVFAEDVKDLFPNGDTKVNSAKREQLERRTDELAQIRAAMAASAADKLQSQKEKEAVYREFTLKTEAAQKELLERATEALPDGCSEEVAETVIESLGGFAKSSTNSIITLAKETCSSGFISNLIGVAQIAVKNVKKLIETFKDEFFKSEKWKQVCERYEKIQRQKAECEELRQEKEKTEEAVQSAKKVYEEKLTEFKKIKTKVQEAIRWAFRNQNKGLDLTAEQQKNYVQNHDPRSYQLALEANNAEKAAKDALWDAESANRLANSFYTMAEQKLQCDTTCAMLNTVASFIA